MAQTQDPLDVAMRINDLGEDEVVSDMVRKTPGKIDRDDQDENMNDVNGYESGVDLADHEMDGVFVGGVLGSDIDPDLVQFDEDGNIVKKNPAKQKTGTDPNDPFADDDEEDEELVIGHHKGDKNNL